jgi:hypothetical protein
MDEENTTFLSGDYASSLFIMTSEVLEEEKRKRSKVHALLHLTAINVYHSHLTKIGELGELGKLN